MQRRWLTAIEILTAFVAAGLFTFACSRIRVDPLERLGQVSGMATIAMRFIVVSVALLVALGLSARLRGGAWLETVSRLVCAAFAGLASATFAAGVLLALRGTPFGFGGVSGDAGTLCQWAELLARGEPYSSVYPPLQVYLVKWIAEVQGGPTAHAIKWFQLLGVAAIGPATYAAWRLLMRPAWALGLAVVSIVPLIEPYRPYAGLVLAILIPVLLKFLDVLRVVGELKLQRVMQYAAMFGLGLGLLCLLYSGWYQWSAPGFIVATLIVFPWRDWKRALLFCGIAGFVFVLCVLKYVLGFAAGSGIKDKWVYIDALLEPTYFTMWRGGAPGDFHWQPLGELGGVGLFAVVLAVGLGIALTLGRRNTNVIALVSIVVGCFLLRLWHAHNMFATKLVQLWPRTSAEILCCMLVLCVFALYLVIDRIDTKSVWRSPSATVAVVASLAFILMMASAATTDQYVPRNRERSASELAFMAQRLSRKKPSVAPGATITTSSSLEGIGFSKAALIDGNLATPFSSALGRKDDHEEWIELRWEGPKQFSHAVLYPAGDGFPLDFAIDVWNGSNWVQRRDWSYAPEPYGGMVVELLPNTDGATDSTTGLRFRATKLRQLAGSSDYVLRLGEIELR